MPENYITEEGWFGSRGYYYMDLIPGVSIGGLRWGCPIETAKRILAQQYPQFYKKGVEKEIATERDGNQYITCPGSVTLVFVNGKLESAEIERTIFFAHWRILVNGKRLEGDTLQTIMFQLGMTNNPDMAKGLYVEEIRHDSSTTISNGGGVDGYGVYGGVGSSYTYDSSNSEFKIIAKAGINQPSYGSPTGQPMTMPTPQSFQSKAPRWHHEGEGPDAPKIESVEEQKKAPKQPSWMKNAKSENNSSKEDEENKYLNKDENSFLEDEDSLTTYYNQLKGNNVDTTVDTDTKVDLSKAPISFKRPTPTERLNYNMQVNKNVDKLKDDCCQHIILNIYLQTNPMDNSYKHRCYHKMNHDIDSMLASRGMGPAQYLTAAAEKTKSPVLEYFVRGVNKICDMYREDAFAQYNDAIDKEIKLTTPPAPDLSDGNINKHLVDLEGDPQAQEVLAAIENQTKSQIVNNISNLLINKKQEDDMEFDPEPNDSIDVEESTISIGMDYVNHYMMINESNVEIDDDLYEEFLGLCIRESVLDEMNKCLGMTSPNNKKDFRSTITFGNGIIVNEVSIDELVNN